MKFSRRNLLIGAGAIAVAGDVAARGRLPLSGGTVAGPTPPGSAFITVTMVGSPKGDGGDLYRGYQLNVGSQPLTITALGRWVGTLNGSVHTHTLGIYQQRFDPITNGNPGVVLPGTNVTVDISGGTPGTYLYASLPANIVLWPGQTYYILSFEPGGGVGDIWYGGNTLTTTADASIGQAATWDPSSKGIQTFSEAGWVPVNFQYNVGTTGGEAQDVGSVVPGFTLDSNEIFTTTALGVVTGTVTVGGSWSHGGVVPGGSVTTYQWFLNGVAKSPVLTSTESGGQITLNWTGFDTTGVADGTHHLYPRIYDNTAAPTQNRNCVGNSFIIANSGPPSNGDQTVPTATFSGTKPSSPVPDFVAYDHLHPDAPHTPHAFPYTFIPGAANPISPFHSNPALLLGNSANWVGEMWIGGTYSEYQSIPRYATITAGGILVTWDNGEFASSLEAAYLPVVQQNTSGGARLNCLVTPYATLVEDPAGGGKWWGVDLGGSVYSVTSTAGVVPLVGGTQDKTQPTLLGSPDQVEATKTFLGNWSGAPDVDFGAGNDICFDPRDGTHKIFYVVSGVDHWIGKVDQNTSPATVTVYAGVPGATGYTEGAATPVHTTGSITGTAMTLASGSGVSNGMYVGGEGVDAGVHIIGGGGTSWVVSPAQGTPVPGGTTLYLGAATFNQPTSIIMDSSGTMYVSDQLNQAIRKITSPSLGVAGTVSTLCGGTVGPTPPTTGQVANTTTYNVTSIAWSAGIGTVVMNEVSTTIKLGYTLRLAGAINTGGSGNPNTSTDAVHLPSYVVIDWTDSLHFKIQIEAAYGNPNPTGVVIGTLSGSMTLTQLDADLYSSPTAVAFASAGATLPLPMALRWTSHNNIMLIELGTTAARLISLNTGDGQAANTIARISSFNGHMQPQSGWTWGDCDYAGMCGPVDGITMTNWNDNLGAAHQIWQCSLGQQIFDGVSIGLATYAARFGGDGVAGLTNGTIDQAGTQHYPWAMAYSRTEGRFATSGFLGNPPVFFRIVQPSDPVFDFNETVFDKGSRVIGPTGTAVGFPFDGFRPAIWSLFGQGGAPLINAEQTIGGSAGKYTYDDLVTAFPSTTFGDSGSVALGNYVRSGMGGSVPRPEITGNDWRDLEYSIRRATLEGTAGPTVYQPGPNDPDILNPVILAITSASRVDGTHISVSWTTNKPTVGMIFAGTPHQYSAYGAYPMYSALSAPSGTYGTSHTATCQVLSGYSPVPVTVVVKDVAGNFTHTLGRTIT